MNSEEESDIRICCVPIEAENVVAGSKIYTCEECLQEVWISPSSIEYIAQLVDEGKGHHLVCVACAMLAMAEDDKPELFRVQTETANEELRALEIDPDEVNAWLEAAKEVARQHGHPDEKGREETS